MVISKSDFLLYLKHPAWLWLKVHDRAKLPQVDEGLQRVFDKGHEFEDYAEKLFPEGVRLGFGNYTEYKNLPTKTIQVLEGGAKTIFQGRFEAGGLTAIVDVLDKISDGVCDLVEIKSATRAKPEHIPDLAFQTIVLEKAGLKVRSISVIHVNSDYVREGPIRADELCTRTNVTTEVREMMSEVEGQIEQAVKTASLPAMPDLSPRYANPGALADWLEIYNYIHPDLPKYSIYKLAGRSVEQIGTLEDLGVTTMDRVPDEVKLTPRQKNQVTAIISGERYIDREMISNWLKRIEYPLYFFDYETLGDLIPPFDGMKPYLQIPFQYSLHRIDKPGGTLTHMEYLHQDKTNPGRQLTRQLQQEIGNEGTVLVWFEGFEKTINDIVGEMLPDSREFYLSLNRRIEDLMVPFAKGWYVDRDFMGSASLKKVQPVLAPELEYEALTIGEGGAAQRIWMETFLEGKNQDRKEQIMTDLLTYCKYDTLVMVKIWEELEIITNN